MLTLSNPSTSKQNLYFSESFNLKKNLLLNEDVEFEGFIPPDKFLESLTISENSMSADCWNDQLEDLMNVQKLTIENSASLLPSDILLIVSGCKYLQELSIPNSLISNELLMKISSKNENLKMIKVEAFNETKPFINNAETYTTLENCSPDLNLILMLHLSDTDDYDNFLLIKTPLTHLYLNGSPTESVFYRITENCPRLVELIISSFDQDTIDQYLILLANKCQNLSAIALGDCDLTCSGLVKFVTICKERLRILYVWETSLIEDNNFDITEATSKVSNLLGRSWEPEYIPPW